jgi:hypothetical protein
MREKPGAASQAVKRMHSTLIHREKTKVPGACTHQIVQKRDDVWLASALSGDLHAVIRAYCIV